MTLHELKSTLRAHPDSHPRFILPDGDTIPAHFHVTEVGHVAKRFIDCGGTIHDTTDTCVLQTYVADDVDHRLSGKVFAKILDLGEAVLPHGDLNVEVEYDCCVVSQYPIANAQPNGEYLDFKLGSKQTDCLAKEKCGIGDAGCGPGVDTNATAASAPTASCC
jgi:hypothetical protein